MEELTPQRWEEVRAVFDRALEISPEQRDRFLDESCAGDAALRRHVEELLAADDEPAAVFESSFDDVAEALAPADADVGRRIGPYRIEKRLGTGGMGIVYLAERADGQYSKQVALKLVKRGMDSEEILRRFRNERQILAGLQHPHIAGLGDGGMTDDGRPYLVMEYVDGTPIDDFCDVGKLDINSRIRLFEAVLQAVQYAHQNLVVHRDLKPSNIMVREDGTVKLLDFGIAKLLSDDQAGITRTGVQVLTPEYAAPEQKAGGPVTTATDIYALGAVLYELLTGHRPAVASTSPQSEPVRPSNIVAKTSAEKAAHRGTSADRLRKRLHGDLDTILLKALQNDPDRRYASAEAFLADIRRHLLGLPVEAQPDSTAYRARKFVRRHRYAVAAAAVFALILVAFAVSTAVQQAATLRERDRATLERDKAEVVATFLADLFDASDPFAGTGRLDTLRVRDLLERGAQRVERELQHQPAVRSEMLDVIGNVYQSLGLYEKAAPLLTEALEQRTDLYGPSHPDVAESLQSLGRFHLGTSEYEKAAEHFEQALTISRDIDGSRSLAAGNALAGLGTALRFQSEYDRAENLLRDALDVQRASLGERHLDVASSMLELGRVYQDRGTPAAAESLYREVLSLHRSLLGEEHPQVATSLDNLAIVLRQQTKLDDAEPFVREAFEIRQQVLGPEHPQTLSSLYELASLARDSGHYEEAVTLFQQVTDLDRKVLGPRHHYVGLDLRELGITYARMKEYDAALSAYESSLDILRRVLPPDHMDISVAVNGIGYTYLQMGDARRAEPVLRDALRMRISSMGEESWQTGVSKSVLGECLMKQARYDEAEAYLVGGLETLQAANGPTEAALRRLVSFYETIGRDGDATTYREMLAETTG